MTPEERGRKVAPLIRESVTLNQGPFLLSDEDIAASRARFRRMRALVADGRVEEARRVWWWPESQDPPRKHYFETDRRCSCRPASSGTRGSDGLCRYCNGHIER